jgi:hypothetical protein
MHAGSATPVLRARVSKDGAAPAIRPIESFAPIVVPLFLATAAMHLCPPQRNFACPRIVFHCSLQWPRRGAALQESHGGGVPPRRGLD